MDCIVVVKHTVFNGQFVTSKDTVVIIIINYIYSDTTTSICFVTNEPTAGYDNCVVMPRWAEPRRQYGSRRRVCVCVCVCVSVCLSVCLSSLFPRDG